MAECYLGAITEVQPHGPYLLAGMCFGGLVALEIARRLLESGESIGLLALIDTYPHPRDWPLRLRFEYSVINRLQETLSDLSGLSRHEVLPYMVTKLGRGLRKLRTLMSGTRSLKAPDTLAPAVKAVYDAGIAALAKYRPQYYPGKVSYLMCGYHVYLPHGPSGVWSKLVGQLKVDVAPVLTQPKYVADWLFNQIQESLGTEQEPPDHHQGSRRIIADEPASTVHETGNHE